MKLREREMPLDPEVERELEAIDRALGDEPVDPDLEGIAQLALELRSERPEPTAEVEAKLDLLAAAGFPPRTTDRLGRASRAVSDAFRPLREKGARRLLPALSAASVFVIAIGIGVSQSGILGDAKNGTAPAPVQQAPETPRAEPGPAGTAQRSDNLRDAVRHLAPAVGRLSPNLQGSPHLQRESRAGFSAGADLLGNPQVPPAKRKIARRVDLALSASPDRFRDAADGVLDVVRDHRGFVVRSSVSGGDPDVTRSQLGHASFELRIPAGELPAAMGDLSDLGHVVSRTDGTIDITSRFVAVKKRIAANEKARQKLLRQLAEAVTLTEQESIKRRLAIVEAQLSAAQEDLGAIQRRVHLVPVSVTIDADRALAGDGDGGGWSLGDAVDDAGKVLSVTAGVLLVSAAVLGPLAILVALIWLVTRTLARLRRERALDQI